MNFNIIKMPDISNYIQYTMLHQITNDTSIIMVFKSLFRSDDILIDIYKNDITENSKIISGKKLTSNSLISLPNRNVDFSYYIYCVDQDGVNEPVSKKNLYKFYLQFMSYDSGEIIDKGQ